ncbi:uncharacterized protein LOC144710237 isoform X2 [Wolffia australiana]
MENSEEIVDSLSCASAASSEDDEDRRNHLLRWRRSRRRNSRSGSPWTYDVWISEPAPVEERRRRLLQRLGLIGDEDDQIRSDPATIEADRRVDLGRSASYDVLDSRDNPSSLAVARSTSSQDLDRENLRISTIKPSSAEEGPREDGDLYCTIKNLNSGEEFVVKELREDGMWKNLREVGTGRQLTMEEFQSSVVGLSPIVQELMRRQIVDDQRRNSDPNVERLRLKKTGAGWMKSIRTVVHRREKRSSDERDTSSRRSSSATDDSQDIAQHVPERVKVRHYGKSWKDLTALILSQEIRAHGGSIWTVKFSLDGKFLGSAGEDCIIHIWQVIETESDSEGRGSSAEKMRRSKVDSVRKSSSFDQIVMPENIFALSDKPICSFRGHLRDVLDLSWSRTEHLLSSSMDKTVRLWHMSSSSCLKIFSHSDYVTCIQFNPVDDNHFISGSLDSKVRIWSIPCRQVVDWKDVHEMVTAACYTPDGQRALVGSHKGNCHVYDVSGNKLQLGSQVDLQSKKKRPHHKKVTGFQFVPGSSTEVLVTSADSRIRVVDGLQVVQRFKGAARYPRR